VLQIGVTVALSRGAEFIVTFDADASIVQGDERNSEGHLLEKRGSCPEGDLETDGV